MTADPMIAGMVDIVNPTNRTSKLSATRRNRLTNRAHRDVAAEVSQIIGKNLKEARKRSGYSLEKLAHKSGVSRAMLGQIETAKSVPTVTVIWRIADALGTTVGALITDPEPEPSTITRANNGREEIVPFRPLGISERSDIARFYEIRLGAQQSATLAAQSLPFRARLVVARGGLRLSLPAQPTMDLCEGDTADFDAQQAAKLVNTSAETLIAFLAQYPRRQG